MSRILIARPTNIPGKKKNRGIGSITPADADWAARSMAAGVIRAFHFNDASQIGNTWVSNPNAAWFYDPGSSTNPSIASDFRCSGSGSLYFEIPPFSGANACGAWTCNFGDLRTENLFGENSEFWFQCRVRWNAAMTQICAQNVGTKFWDVGTGGPNDALTSTNSNLKIVQQTAGALLVPILYTYPNNQLYTVEAGPDYDYQNAYNGGLSCMYTGLPTGCWQMPTDEWVTFKQHTQIFSRLAAPDDNRWDIRIRLYVAQNGNPSQGLLDWNSTVNGYFPGVAGAPVDDEKYGRLNIFPYITGKAVEDDHATGKIWVDEVIISTQDIADPVAAPLV